MGSYWRESKKRYAYHEAGHTVMAYLAGDVVLSASIVPDEDDHSKGRIVLRGGSPPPDRQRNLERLMVYYAGEAAEAIAFGEPTFAHSQDDLKQACDLSDESGLELSADDCVKLYKQTERRLRRHWRKVQGVATALQRRGCVDWDGILRIVAPHPNAPGKRRGCNGRCTGKDPRRRELEQGRPRAVAAVSPEP